MRAGEDEEWDNGREGVARLFGALSMALLGARALCS